MKSSVLKTAAKLLVLVVLCCAPLTLSAENNPHLVAPKSIDFGLCPRGGEIPVTYSKVLTLANNSDEDLYLLNAMILSDSTYSKYRKYSIFNSIFFLYYGFNIGYQPFVVPAKKSVQFAVWFNAEDTRIVGDSGNVTFDWKVVFQSRTSPEFPRLYVDMYNDTINLHAVAVDSQKISGSQLSYYFPKGCDAVFKNSVTEKYSFNFSNTLPEDVRLDSLTSSNDGAPKPEYFYPIDSNDAKVALPIEMPQKGSIRIGVFIDRTGIGENHVAVTGHFTGRDTKKYYTAQGSIDIHDTVLHDAQFSSFATFFQSDDGQSQVKKEQVFLSGCSSETLWIDSIVVTKEWQPGEVRVLPGTVPFPFIMDPGKNYRLDIIYTPKTRGRHFGFIKAYFHTNDGRQIVRALDFQTYYPDASSISETPDESTTKPSLLLTTPQLSMKLLGECIEAPQVYDIFGSSIDVSARLSQGVMSFEGLSSGVYCLMFKTNAGMVSRRVLYMR
ncbi:MAG: hypothetical protein U0264_07305 [Candidatus Kapaibacterium sp.]